MSRRSWVQSPVWSLFSTLTKRWETQQPHSMGQGIPCIHWREGQTTREDARKSLQILPSRSRGVDLGKAWKKLNRKELKGQKKHQHKIWITTDPPSLLLFSFFPFSLSSFLPFSSLFLFFLSFSYIILLYLTHILCIRCTWATSGGQHSWG